MPQNWRIRLEFYYLSSTSSARKRFWWFTQSPFQKEHRRSPCYKSLAILCSPFPRIHIIHAKLITMRLKFEAVVRSRGEQELKFVHFFHLPWKCIALDRPNHRNEYGRSVRVLFTIALKLHLSLLDEPSSALQEMGQAARIGTMGARGNYRGISKVSGFCKRR